MSSKNDEGLDFQNWVFSNLVNQITPLIFGSYKSFFHEEKTQA